VHLDHLPGSFFGPSNLVDLLRHRALHQANDRAYTYLVDGENEEINITYQELDEQARAIAVWLMSLGLSGERALLLYPAGLEFIAAFFGCLYAGVVAVPAYPPRRNRSMTRIQAIVDDAEAKVALTTAAVLERVQLVLDETPSLKRLTWLPTDQLPPGLAEQWRSPDVHGDTLAFLQYTSGSTGTPKGVVLTHANLMHNSATIAYAFEHTRSGNGVFWLPSYHDMGLIGGILQPLYIGQANVLLSPITFLQKPYRWLKAISKYRATISGGPNFSYDLCVRKVTPEQIGTLDLSRWQLAFNGAEPVRAETIEKFSEMFAPCGFRREAFYPCYGMAEATLLVSGGFRSAPPVIRSFDGRALESHQVVDAPSDEEGVLELVGCGGNLLDQRIVIADPHTMSSLSGDQVGEVWVAGPSVAQGYWNRREETERTFRAYLADTGEGPFLRTGDLGFLKDGELFITGRIKDLIIIRGLNHYPQDIEATASKSHPRLRHGQAAALVCPVEGRDRLVIIHEIERRQNRDLEPVYEAVRREVAAEHELNVEHIVLIKAGSIPKTSSGKIQRHACRQGFLDGSLEIVGEWNAASAAAAAPASPLHAAVADCGGSSDANSAGRPWFVGSHGDRCVGSHGDSFVGSHGENGEAAPPREATTVEIVMDQVRRIAKERAAGMTIDSSIVELGLDSLERMEIVAALEDMFGGRFPEEVLPTIETPREVAAAVELYLGKKAVARPADAEIREISPADFNFDQFPEYLKLKQAMAAAAAVGLPSPFFKVHQSVIDDTTVIDGREMVSFSSYNYLGMSGDPVVAAAVKRAVDQYGTSVSASRLVSGEKQIHRDLEATIAQFLGVDDAIVFVGGHGTNETTLGHLFGAGDLILHDALAHNSIVQGAILSGARRRPFPHNDYEALDKLLTELRPAYRRVCIAIEGAYSMDGDFPELPPFVEIKRRHHAFLYIDEAHSLGILGRTGRGIAEHWGVEPRDVDVWMGTLSKALGSCGGYIAGNQALVEYLKYTAPGFVFANGISPSNAAAALAALQILQKEPDRVQRLRDRSRLFLSLARDAGLNTGLSDGTPIIPVILGNSHNALRLSYALFDRGISVQPILYPAVEERAARLRFFITSKHSEQQLRDTVQAVAEELAKIDPQFASRPAHHNGVAKQADAVSA
jgi:8-amino-7-oxononanoate synthase